jgi:ABC-2 type transport system ATP-binding protein
VTVADRPCGGFSLGMSQRLGIAAALLGDPGVLMFDEPVNGLDPEGIVWVRQMMRALAAEGRTVFVSSHLMSEMALTADHLIVIGRGRLIADTSVSEFVDSSSVQSVRVQSPDASALIERIREQGATVRPAPEGEFDVVGMESAEIGRLAAPTDTSCISSRLKGHLSRRHSWS